MGRARQAQITIPLIQENDMFKISLKPILIDSHTMEPTSFRRSRENSKPSRIPNPQSLPSRPIGPNQSPLAHATE
jgi:hypothetical protein